MRLSIVISTLMLAASLLPGQEKPAPAPAPGPFEAVIIPVKTLSGDSFNRLANLLRVFDAKFAADDKLRTIVVYAPPEVVAKMRRVVEQLDQPGSEAALGRNIEMTLSFLRCSTKAQPDTRALPADLDPVAKQLRAATQYQNIQLWDIVPLRLQEGKETSHSFRLPDTMPNLPNAYTIATLLIRPEAVRRRDAERYVRFDLLKIGFRIPQVSSSVQPGVGGAGINLPVQWTYLDVGLNTAGDFKEDQKTVLGKVSGLDAESAIFVVVSLKVLD